MFYARGAVIAGAAHAGGSSVAVSVIRAHGGGRISSAHATGAAAASGRSGGDYARHISGLCPLRATHGLPGCAAGFVAGAFRTLAGARAALPLSRLPLRMPAAIGSAGRG